jgi:hypothetical protein
MFSLRIKLALFVLLSAADFGATWLLLRAEDGVICESNPVACWWLNQHGWLGLAVFKTATVLVASVLVVALSRLRPLASAHLLSFGCAVLLGVVCYSCFLLYRGHRPEEECLAVDGSLLEQSRLIEERVRDGQDYGTLLRRLSCDLVAERCSLPEAAEILERSKQGEKLAWRAQLQRSFPCRSDRGCFAANVLFYAVAVCREVPSCRKRIPRLAAEFRSTFGPLPPRLIANLREWGREPDAASIAPLIPGGI